MKKLLIVIGVIIALLIIAAVIAPHFINADLVRRELIAQVKEKTGRDLTIGGNLSVTFFPVAGVHAEQVALSNPPGFPDNTPMIAVQSMTVDVAVLPLLHGNVEIKDFTLDEPAIHLHVAANGAQNWAFAPAKKTAAPAAPATKESSSPTAALKNLSISGVSIKNGSVTYVDDQKHQRQSVQHLDADLSMGALSAPFSLDGKGEWNGKKISAKAKIGSLSGLFSQRADLSASVDSDPLSLDIKGAISGETFTGNASIKSPSLKELMAWVNPASKPMATPAKLAFSLKSDVACTMNACNATNADIAFDSIAAKGNLKASWQGTPDITANLATGKIDFNPFLAPPQQADLHFLISDAEAANAPWSNAPIDFSGLRSANANIIVSTEGVVWRKFTLGKTTFHATLQQGHLNASMADATMYGGHGSASLALDANASVSAQASFKGIQVQPLLMDAANLGRLSGAGDVDVSVNGHGNSESAIVSSLSGNGKFNLANGQISGVNLLNLLHNIAGAASGGGSTPIQAMSGTFTIAQGVVSNHDLIMKMPDTQVSGEGTVNLPAYEINYRLSPQTVRAAGSGNAAGAGVAVPVLIQGSLNNPRFAPDVGSVLKNALQNPKEFRQQLKNSEGSIKDQLKGLKNLKGLFGK